MTGVKETQLLINMTHKTRAAQNRTKVNISETASKFLKLVEDSSLGGRCKVTFGDLEIGVYETLEEMQNGVAERIFTDLDSVESEEGDGYDQDSLRDDSIEQSLLVVDALCIRRSVAANDSPADAKVIEVEVNGYVESYNGVWTFEFLD